jgi:nucleoporin POM152
VTHGLSRALLTPPLSSAVLNPEHHSFCLGDDRKTASIPIFFNATIPVEVELIRTDLETNQSESIKFSRVQLRDIERKAKRERQEGEQPAVQYEYQVKKPGIYQLGRVLDEYKLEVNRKSPPTFVVPCPKAWVAPVAQPGRCLNDLSDLALQVEGTPPLKIKYSRTVNGKDRSFHFQSLQPEGFTSPLTGLRSTSLLSLGDDDFSWARTRRVPVGLNESMHTSGEWQYSIDEVEDAFGNVVKYDLGADDVDAKPKPKHLVQSFVVKERPLVRLEGCDLRRPLKVAKGESKELPVRFQIAGSGPEGTAHTLNWLFSPIDTLTESGDHGDVISTGTYNARNARDRPMISAPGLYTLKSVSAGSCEGEVQEPSSCLLLNPLEPKVTLRAEEIPDTCAGNSIGLRVDMDLIGTPPFVVRYDVISNGQKRSERVTIPGLRYQMDLIPRTAGHHKYVFTHIGDDIYTKGQKLVGPEYVLEQDVKPAASALIQHSTGKMGSCLGDEVAADILLLGDPPFTLEWEIIHDGKRKQHKATNIQENSFQIRTSPLTQGGEYTLGLTSVQDKRGCRNFLQDELKISVRRQSPRAAFGQVEGKRKMLAVEDSPVKLPVRLTGEGPWKVFYTNSEVLVGDKPKVMEAVVKHDNGYLTVKGRGVYTITDVWDNQCHGVVDSKAATFEVDWFGRPQMSVVLTPGVTEAEGGGFQVEDVCEGDVSGFELALQGKIASSFVIFLFMLLTQSRHSAIHGGIRSPPSSSPGLAVAQQEEVRGGSRQRVHPGRHVQGWRVHLQVHLPRG